MRNKEHILTKLDAQIQKINFLQRQIESGTMSGPDAIRLLGAISKELETLHERLQAE
jgi:hypothetical protein